MDTKRDTQKVRKILDHLKARYPHASCELNYRTHFELLVAVILSAQCTDKRVNIVTDKLFKMANTPQGFLDLGQASLEQHIYSCGFYRQKAKSIISACADIITLHEGEVPKTLEELTALRGVGRKTANVVLSEAYKAFAMAVDTHVFRVSHRLGLSRGKTPTAVERDLVALIKDTPHAHIAHQLFVFHGRYCCKAQKPQCEECVVRECCSFIGTKG